MSESGTIGFLDGPIDSVIRSESDGSYGLIVEGAAGAWTLDLAECEFGSATLTTVPDTRTLDRLTIKMRNHWLLISPRLGPDGELRGAAG